MTIHKDKITLKAEALLDQAGRKAWSNKFTLEGIATALFDDSVSTLSELDRALMDNALRSLVRDIENLILTKLANREEAPQYLSKQLAHDGPTNEDNGGHAYPILEASGVLRATGLIEVIEHRTQAYRLALMIRRMRRESSIASLMDESQSTIIQSLLVAPPPESVDRLKGFLDSETDRIDTFQYPLIRPLDLPNKVMSRLLWWVTAALRHHAVTEFSLDAAMVERSLELAAKAALRKLNSELSPSGEAAGVIEILIANGRFSLDLLLQLLRQGEVSLFEAGFARVTELRNSLVARLLYESGGESLAVACKAVGYDAVSFMMIYGYTRHARLKTTATSEENGSMREFFERIDEEAAAAVLERWRRDADFLYAIKQIDLTE